MSVLLRAEADRGRWVTSDRRCCRCPRSTCTRRATRPQARSGAGSPRVPVSLTLYRGSHVPAGRRTRRACFTYAGRCRSWSSPRRRASRLRRPRHSCGRRPSRAPMLSSADAEAGTSSADHVPAAAPSDVDLESESLCRLVGPEHADLVAGHRRDHRDVVRVDVVREVDRRTPGRVRRIAPADIDVVVASDASHMRPAEVEGDGRRLDATVEGDRADSGGSPTPRTCRLRTGRTRARTTSRCRAGCG